MTNAIDFYFDFSSPYGYLASMRIDAIGAQAGRPVRWHPILLGAIFKVSGGTPLTTIPLKGEYSVRDMARSARLHDIPFRLPGRFPIPTQHAARLALWALRADEALGKRIAGALYRAYFVDDRDISDPQTCADIAAEAGVDRAAALEAMNADAVKEALKSEVQQAIERKVFGSPFVIVDGEPFWGADRLDQVERWLKVGGW
jgi:2-hydroxychromene-2-carboxylate isomerase